MSLSITLDHAQKRVKRTRMGILAQGAYEASPEGYLPGWSQRYYSVDGAGEPTIWFDPITFTGMLRPGPMFAAWWSSNSGITAKYAKSDYTLITPDGWDEVPLISTAQGVYLRGQGVYEPVITAAAVGKNQGMYLSWYGFATASGAAEQIQIECGWNDTADGSAGVSLRIYTSGKTEVWKDGILQARYSIKSQDASETGQQNTASQTVNMLLIPCRHSSLLVVTNLGGFEHVFPDIDPADASPEITTASKFWWYCHTATAQVQCAPISYPASGTLFSIPQHWAEPPEASPAYEAGIVYYDEAYAGTTGVSVSLVEQDASGVFVADGVKTTCRVAYALTGDGSYSPFVYGASTGVVALTASTDSGSSTDLSDLVTRVSLHVPDSPDGVEVELELLDPITAGLSLLQSNRPISIEIGGVVMIDGRTDPPEYEERANQAADRFSIKVRDGFKALKETIRFRDPMPLDQLTITAAITKVLSTAGRSGGAVNIQADTFALPSAGGPSKGEFGALCEVGDSPGEWFERLIDTYAKTWWFGERPRIGGVEVFAGDTTFLGSTPLAVLYSTRAAAIAAGVADADAWKAVFRHYDQHTLEPEANDIWVTGVDPRTRRPIVSHYPDAASQNPITAPGSRPSNWLGEPRMYGLIEPAITSQDACDRAATKLFQRLTPVRTIAEWSCEFLLDADGVPLWRGDVVTLTGKGDFRIMSLSCDFVKEPNGGDTWQWREAKYTGEKI